MAEKILQYKDKRAGQCNAHLLKLAKSAVADECPPQRHRMKMWEEIKLVKQQERVGFDFTRTLGSTFSARWDVVEKFNLGLKDEIKQMNDQIEENKKKYEQQLKATVVARAGNLSMSSSIEQMASLMMHLYSYKSTLESKLQRGEKFREFLQECCDLMGFTMPIQLLVRYNSLQSIFEEQTVEHMIHQRKLEELTETLSQIKTEASSKTLLMHNQMDELYDTLQSLEKSNATYEEFIQFSIEHSTKKHLEVFQVKSTILNIYHLVMNYRCLECKETEQIPQLKEIEMRMLNTLSVVEYLQEDRAKKAGVKLKKGRKRTPGSAMYTEGEVSSSSGSGLFTPSPSDVFGEPVSQNENLKTYGFGDQTFSASSTLTPLAGSTRSNKPSQRRRSNGFLPRIRSQHSSLTGTSTPGWFEKPGPKSRSSCGESSMIKKGISVSGMSKKSSGLCRGSDTVLNGSKSIAEYPGPPGNRPHHPLFGKDDAKPQEVKVKLTESASSVRQNRSDLAARDRTCNALPETARDEKFESKTTRPTKFPALKRSGLPMLEENDKENSPGEIEVDSSGDDLSVNQRKASGPGKQVKSDINKFQSLSTGRANKEETRKAKAKQPDTGTRSLKVAGAKRPMPRRTSVQERDGECGRNNSIRAARTVEDQTRWKEKAARCRTTCDPGSRRYIRDNYLTILARMKLRRTPVPQ